MSQDPAPGRSDGDPSIVRRSFLFEAARLASANFFSSFMVICIGIATVRIWGVEARGRIEVALALPGLLSVVFDLGLGRVMPYMIGKKHAPLDRLISTTLLIWLGFSAASVGVVLWYHTTSLVEEIPPLWLGLAMLYVPLRLFVGITNGFCVGVDRLGYKSTLPFIREPIVLAVLLGLALVPALRAPEHAWIRILAIDLGFAITTGMGVWLMSRYTRVRLTVDPGLLRVMAWRSLTFGIGPLCMDLLLFTPSMLLTVSYFAVPHGDIGNYTVGTGIAMLLMQIAYAVGHVLMSRSVRSTDSDAQARRTLRLLRVGVVGAACMGVGMAVTAPILVPLVYGADTSLAPWLMMILLPGVIGFFGLHTISTDLIARGRPMIVAVVAGLALVCNIAVCSAFAIPRFGVWGAATTTASSYLLAAVGMTVVYLRITRVPFIEALVPRRADFPVEQVVAGLRRRSGKG